MFGLGFWELALILLIAFLVLGPKRLPELAKSIGKGLRELRRASEGLRSSIQDPLEEIRQPLQDLRDQLSETVHTVGAEIEREANQPSPEELKAEEGRRREVEEMYAAAATEEANSCLTEASPPTPPPLPPPAAWPTPPSPNQATPPPIPDPAGGRDNKS